MIAQAWLITARMKLNISEINNMRPLLLLYSSGTGGEFLTNTISRNSVEFNDVLSNYNQERNITTTSCVTLYSPLWNDPDTTSSWIDQSFIEHAAHTIDPSLRIIIKDHPNLYFSKYYWKYLSNLQVVHLTLKNELDYFSRLTYKKLSNKVDSSIIDINYIQNNIVKNANDYVINNIIHWVSQFNWVWESEIHTINTLLSQGKDISIFTHHDSVHEKISEQYDALEFESGKLPYQLRQIYTEYKTVCIDSLAHDGLEFWDSMSVLIPSLDTQKCIAETHKWISNNNSLLDKE
jgi:hypothetical protein